MLDPYHAAFPELQYGSAPEHFRSDCTQDKRLDRSARFQSGRLLPSVAVEACGGRFPRRPLVFSCLCGCRKSARLVSWQVVIGHHESFSRYSSGTSSSGTSCVRTSCSSASPAASTPETTSA